MRNNKNILLVSVSVLVLAAISYAAYASYSNLVVGDTNPKDSDTICTMDALLCPDGVYVGRTGPNCEFVCSPASTSTDQSADKNPVVTTLHLDEKGNLLGDVLTPLQVLEDSRCPTDVQCVQAGVVKVKVKIETGTGVIVETFTLGAGFITDTEAITLTNVSPQKNSKVQITPREYRFTFSAIKK